MTGRPRRVLILTASYGSGHNRVAQTLAEEGRLKEATTWPLPLVKVMVLPEVRP